MNIPKSAAFAITLFFLSLSANAIPITYIHTGSGSGSIDGTSFGTRDFVITAFADTDDMRINSLGNSIIDHLMASITITGVGTFDFITATRTFVVPGFQLVGFGFALGPDLFNGPEDVEFVGWDLVSSIGPIAGIGNLLQWDLGVLTDGGELRFNDGSSAATFQAVISEPGTLTLLSLGLLGLGLARRRNKA